MLRPAPPAAGTAFDAHARGGRFSAPTLQRDFAVRLSYPIHFTRDVLDPTNPILGDVVAGGRRALAVADGGVTRRSSDLLGSLDAYLTAHPRAPELAAEALVFEGGETVKDGLGAVVALHDAIATHGLCRHSYVLAIGGGALLDMAGLAAATAHRGLRLVRIPTTVLAQNDSAIGVKNAVNRDGHKNFVGTFAAPWAVINDSSFLLTLDDRDWRAGTIEAVKVGLLHDAAFVAWIEQQAAALVDRDLAAMEQLVHRCAELHLDHIAGAGDPFESGSSRPLDFGHWSAHELERLSGGRVRHGEAVAIGIALDLTYSHLAGLLGAGDLERSLSLIAALGLPLWSPAMDLRDTDGRPVVLDGLEAFRQHLGGRLTIMLLAGVGRGHEVNVIDEALMAEALEQLRRRAEGLQAPE